VTTTRTLPLLSTTATTKRMTTTRTPLLLTRTTSNDDDHGNTIMIINVIIIINLIIIIMIINRIIILVIKLRVGKNRVCCHYPTTANGRDLSRLWHPHRRRRPISLGLLVDRPRSTFAYRMLIVKSPLLSLLLNKTSCRTVTLA
jgi:hypothetical protein